ncbi:D123-domain-containing protein, partial [Syncephalis pseudoplumigaleata]
TSTAVTQCSFSSWYRKFRAHTFASKIIPLPVAFVEFLLADGIVVEQGRPSCVEQPLLDTSDSETESNDGEDDTETLRSTSFPTLEAQVAEAIQQLGGAVFPKLNWSAPKDAAWIATTRNLHCTTYADILLLMKSSDVVVHDLVHAYDDCQAASSPTDVASPVLVLRQWQTMNPAHEFRCFVRDGCVVAISQRDMAHYAFLEPVQQRAIDAIRQFHADVTSQFALSEFVFDVYFEQLEQSHSMIKLVDFAPWGGTTNPLLFSWEEL